MLLNSLNRKKIPIDMKIIIVKFTKNIVFRFLFTLNIKYLLKKTDIIKNSDTFIKKSPIDCNQKDCAKICGLKSEIVLIFVKMLKYKSINLIENKIIVKTTNTNKLFFVIFFKKKLKIKKNNNNPSRIVVISIDILKGDKKLSNFS